MKRSLESIVADKANNNDHRTHKVLLVERESNPRGVALINSNRVAKKTHLELMELEESLEHADTFVRANTMNKLEIIGRQMKNLQELMTDIMQENKLNNELNQVACNFVKKPGHVYHLYERPSGQKYFSMLSPKEWVNAPHTFLGSFRLEADQSWTPAGKEEDRYAGVHYLQNMFSGSSVARAILRSDNY